MARIRYLLAILFVAAWTLSVLAQPQPTFQSPQHVTAEPPVPWNPPTSLSPRDPVLPINLPTALKLVNARAMDVAIASQRIQQAGAQLEQAKYAWLPTVTIGADYMRHDGRFQ